MPYKTYGCSKCGQQAPKKLRTHGQFGNRMSWIRRHYKKSHPRKFREMYK